MVRLKRLPGHASVQVWSRLVHVPIDRDQRRSSRYGLKVCRSDRGAAETYEENEVVSLDFYAAADTGFWLGLAKPTQTALPFFMSTRLPVVTLVFWKAAADI